MHRRLFIGSALASAAAIAVSRIGLAAQDSSAMKGKFPPIDKTRAQWKKILDARPYQVLFEEATEKPWSSPLNDEKRAGTYVCAACFLPLFESSAKYDSGTGWPSFFESIDGNTGTRTDWKLLLPRTEYHCARCGGHQGHVFDDGPPPTGKRWCNNGVALQFVPQGEDLPALRT